MMETGLNDIRLMTQPSGSLAKFRAQVVEVQATDVSEFDILEIAPDAFIGVQVRGVARQAFKMDALCGALAQELAHGGAMMSRQAIPDDQEFAGDMPQQMG